MFQFRFAVSFDEAHYLRLSAGFLQRGFAEVLHPYWPPLYPVFVACFRLITGNFELAGRLINVISGALLIPIIYRMTRNLFTKQAAIIAGLLVAIYPPLAFGNTNVLSESLYTLLGIGGLFLGWKGIQKKRIVLGFAAGLCWGMDYLMRPEGTGFLLVYIGVCSILLFQDFMMRGKRKRLLIPVMAVCGFFLISAPYLVYLRQETGGWTLSTKGRVNQQLEAVLMFDMGEVKDPHMHLTADNRYLPYDMAFHMGNIQELNSSSEGRERIVRIPWQKYFQKYAKNFYQVIKYALPSIMTLFLLILWAIGFFGEPFEKGQGKLIFYIMANVVFFWFFLIPLFHVNDRYFMPLFPLTFIWMGKGCILLYQWIIRSMEGGTGVGRWQLRPNSWYGVGGVMVILMVSIVPELGKILTMQRYNSAMYAEPVEFKAAGQWLKAQSDHPPVLMSLNKAVDYYAGQYDMRIGASFSYDPLVRNLAYARHRQVEYLVFSSRYLDWFPNLRPLVEHGDPSPELELIYEDVDPTGIKTVIYRLLPGDTVSGESEV